MRVEINLMKPSTEIIDLSKTINPRVGDDDLLLPLHIIYGDNQTDMRGKDVEFISEDTNKQRIYVGGTCNTDTPGDNLYMGNLTFRFPANTFKADGTYDPDKTMFRIVDKATNKVISSVNVKITVMKNNIEFDFDPDKSSYDSRAEAMLQDFHDKGQAMLDEIKDLNNQAKSNVSGDTATTANAAKKQADQNAGDISDIQGEVAGARGRFADMAGREDAQDIAINQKESIVNANANYAELKRKDAQQDAEIANKAGKLELENKLAQMDLRPEAFENKTALESKYPNGKPGIMVTVDDGHKWVWSNNRWNDAGIYQSAGIADRSIEGNKIAERDTAFIATQPNPWIIDYQNRQLSVAKGSNINDATAAYAIPAKVYDLPKDNKFYWISYNPDTQEIETQDENIKLSKDNYLLGWIDFPSNQTFLKFSCIDSTNILSNGDLSRSTLVTNEHLPLRHEGLITLAPWIVDTYSDNPSITVKNNAMYFAKGDSYYIPAQTYTFEHSDDGVYYLYLDNLAAKDRITIKSTNNYQLVPKNSPLIGFIETNSHSYCIFDNVNSFFCKSRIITPGKFTVDFDSGILNLPTIWQMTTDQWHKVYAKTASISFDISADALYVGIDKTKNDVETAIIFDKNLNKIIANYQYLGWISITTKEYDFGKYGSTHDLANQPWLNKEVTCLGDSITEGGTDGPNLTNSYVPRLKRYIGVSAHNAGKCGAKVAKAEDGDISFVTRCASIKDQDVVTIFGGINDFQWGTPLGTMADGPDKPTTFYGALKYVITTLSTNNPEAKLMLITPMKTTKFQYHTFDDKGELMKNSNGNTQLDFVNAIKQVGDYYSIPVLDMYRCSNYSPYLSSQVGTNRFTIDGLHPTDNGYERIAQTIGHAINNL